MKRRLWWGGTVSLAETQNWGWFSSGIWWPLDDLGHLGCPPARKQRPKCREGEGVAYGCLAHCLKPGSVLEEGGQQPPRMAPMFTSCPHPPLTQAVMSTGNLQAESSLWGASSLEGCQEAEPQPSSPGRCCDIPVSGMQLRSSGGTPVIAPTAGKGLG